jgi:predicted acylesterase/phospholipase RssA
MTIKHLVISGGANTGFVFFGILKQLLARSFLELDEIETIYATSVGSLTAVYFSLGYSVEDIESFVITRPWHHVFKLDFNTIVRAVQEGGLFNQIQFNQMINAMLLGKDLELDITLQEFHQVSKKELHFYTTSYGTFELVDLSYKTHPNWKLVDAIYASCSLPILFDPFMHQGQLYIDGGILKNYPLNKCLEDGCDPENILGIFQSNKEEEGEEENDNVLTPLFRYKLFDYIISLLTKIWSLIKLPRHEMEDLVLNQVPASCASDPWKIMEAFQSKEERIRLVHLGITAADRFLEKNGSHN